MWIIFLQIEIEFYRISKKSSAYALYIEKQYKVTVLKLIQLVMYIVVELEQHF